MDLLNADGKPVQSERYAPCPQCGRPEDKRIPSASFGEEIYLICVCGNEFGKRLKCQKPIL